MTFVVALLDAGGLPAHQVAGFWTVLGCAAVVGCIARGPLLARGGRGLALLLILAAVAAAIPIADASARDGRRWPHRRVGS